MVTAAAAAVDMHILMLKLRAVSLLENEPNIERRHLRSHGLFMGDNSNCKQRWAVTVGYDTLSLLD